jgi:integrase
MLRLAHQWRIIDRIPKIRLLRGERNREFVLSREQERIYLEFCPQLLHDAAVLMLDTGLGPAEALGLQWSDIRPDYRQVREGKTRYRARSLSLTSRLRSMLEVRRRDSTSKFVFAGGSGKPPVAEFARASACAGAAPAQIAAGVRVIFIEAYGAYPARGNGRRRLHHHAN